MAPRKRVAFELTHPHAADKWHLANHLLGLRFLFLRLLSQRPVCEDLSLLTDGASGNERPINKAAFVIPPFPANYPGP
jgi:hypothetical protein